MSKEQIAALLALAVADIIEQFGDLATEDLQALLAAEQAEKKPRQTLVDALKQELLVRAGETAKAKQAKPEASPKKKADAGGKAARGEEIPAWQKPDYTGPLDVSQAMWRNQHIRAK